MAKPRLRQGEMRDLGTLQSPSRVNGTAGSVSADFVTVSEDVWMRIAVDYTKGREFREGEGMNAEETAEIKMRFRDDVTQGWRILANGIIWNIKSAANLEGASTILVCMCTSGVNDG